MVTRKRYHIRLLTKREHRKRPLIMRPSLGDGGFMDSLPLDAFRINHIRASTSVLLLLPPIGFNKISFLPRR